MAKFTVEIKEEDLAAVKAFHEQSGIFPDTREDIIRMMFWLADLGTGEQVELQDAVVVTEV